MVHGNTHFRDLKGHPRGVVEKEADDDRLMQRVCAWVVGGGHDALVSMFNSVRLCGGHNCCVENTI